MNPWKLRVRDGVFRLNCRVCGARHRSDKEAWRRGTKYDRGERFYVVADSEEKVRTAWAEHAESEQHLRRMDGRAR